MAKLTLKQKLFGITVAVLVITLLTSVTTWRTNKDIRATLSEVTLLDKQEQVLSELREALMSVHLAAMDIIVDMSRLKGVASKEHLQQLADSRKQIERLFAETRKLASSEDERRLEKPLDTEIQRLRRLTDDMLAVIATRDIVAAQALDDPIDTSSEKARELLNGYIDAVKANNVRALQNVQAAIDRAATLKFIGDAVTIAVIALLMWLLGRSILIPLAQATKAADAIATGDLRADIQQGGTDEIGEFLTALSRMRDGLAWMTQQIHDTSSAIGASLIEVRASLVSQSAAASEQAAAVNEATATLAEISATSKQTMERTVFLGEIAEKARIESGRGQSAVGEAVLGMDSVREKVEAVAASILELSKKNQQIGNITDAVDDIARQSKMLALNASIEAARAGEAGQGFAVVAKEIANLAEQSRDSTSQVRAILLDIQTSSERAVLATEEGTKQVAIGNRQVQDAGRVIGSLGDVVQQTATGSQQITAAVRQEAAGIEQIVTALREIASATTNAVSSTRQAEDAMENLASVTAELQDRIKFYRL